MCDVNYLVNLVKSRVLVLLHRPEIVGFRVGGRTGDVD